MEITTEYIRVDGAPGYYMVYCGPAQFHIGVINLVGEHFCFTSHLPALRCEMASKDFKDLKLGLRAYFYGATKDTFPGECVQPR